MNMTHQPKYIRTMDGYLKLPAYRPPTDSDYAFGDDYEHLIAHCMYDPNETMFGFEIGEQEGESELLGQILKLAACRHAGWPGANGDQKIVELVHELFHQIVRNRAAHTAKRLGWDTAPWNDRRHSKHARDPYDRDSDPETYAGDPRDPHCRRVRPFEG